MSLEIVTTSDGSHTIFVPGMNEHYHSVHGAVQESLFIFVNNGFKFSKANPVAIFEVGFGTGLNALLTAIECRKEERNVIYTTIEKYPIEEESAKLLNHGNYAGIDGRKIFEAIHASEWNRRISIMPNFTLHKIKGDILTENLNGRYDLIYFDAFGPDKQPEMWTREIFEKIASVTKDDGIFVTYSAKGEVKRNLKACGFEVTHLPGPPGKRQITRAVKIQKNTFV